MYDGNSNEFLCSVLTAPHIITVHRTAGWMMCMIYTAEFRNIGIKLLTDYKIIVGLDQ